MTATINLNFRLGETWSLSVICQDSSGNIINLAGVAIRWRLSINGTTALDLALNSGITVVSAAGGQCLITVTPAMQAAAQIAAGYFKQQCRLTLADGVTVSDQFAGSFQVQPSLF